eukprot:GHVT01075965.1.p1 GENE.GHVT01075965.1~~GHVT01075965.1.p1  ORF type:complete len:138 (-),score=2.19 GHVT01075965.1:1012-1425(-)
MRMFTLLLSVAVEVDIKSRRVRVKGKHGELKREFRHLPVDIRKSKEGSKIVIGMWFGTQKNLACIRTLASHLNNMMTGVTKVGPTKPHTRNFEAPLYRERSLCTDASNISRKLMECNDTFLNTIWDSPTWEVGNSSS